MNGSVAKKTQEVLGRVIKKPPLTEKLLSKPPFRYLHDILSEVIRTTGFMKGLYGEAEMKSDNVKDKDSKIAFLQKAIDVVMLVSGEPLSAKPARIVAGHEPEKTNELLQAIAKCCLNKLSSEEAVRRVLAGDKVDLKGKPSTSRSQGKENREGRERHQDREEKREIKESSLSREQKDPDRPKDPESKRSEKDRHRDGERSEKGRERDRTKDRDRDKDKSRDRDKEKARDKERDRDKDRDRNKERERDKEREKNKERDSHKERDQESHKDRERERDKDRERDRDKRRDRDKDRERERERQKELEDKPKEKTDKKVRAEELSRQKPLLEESSKNHKAEPAEVLEAKADEPTEASQLQTDSPARIPRPSSAKGQRRWPKAGAPDESDSDGAGDNPSVEKQVHLENGDASDIVPSHTPHSRRIPRPSSARPAPPRVKRQESYTDGAPVERLGSAKAPAAVIVEGKKLSDDEDDEDGQFVVEEAVPPPPDMPELEVEPSIELQGDEKHGGLVKKILETKKDFESSPSSQKSKDQDRTPVLEAARKKERELVAREIERLRSSVQTVCRSALPLGKIMDYIQEDMDAMRNELQTWRKENREHAQALLEEQRITDSAVEPLKAELTELEQLIKDQQDKICAIKSNILKNEEKIHKMVSSINVSSQT
ncbi:TRAF3-interacting protein 1 isoform X3 [Astyanax mexicanus]|uniref:TRAF3-interacting protein 1 isoform X3 n=1 Tax=Astyanax mexicanus TaxID=7994 RepID=UPI0020CAA0E3|nr:TRAF3-interacting protein 1 isoform X3 [Astyanax mexicanus]